MESKQRIYAVDKPIDGDVRPRFRERLDCSGTKRTRRLNTAGDVAGSQQVLASGAAPALDQALPVGVVVISELFAPANLPRRANPDRAIDDVDVAVGTAGGVDEAS